MLTIFGAQRREGVVQFAHALHTATSTSAITKTTNICAASFAYQIPRYTCVLNITCPMHTHMQACLCTTNCTIFAVSVREVSLRACSSVFETLVQAYPKVQTRSSTLAVKLRSCSVASSTLEAKIRVLSQRSLEGTRSLDPFAALLQPLSKLRPI